MPSHYDVKLILSRRRREHFLGYFFLSICRISFTSTSRRSCLQVEIQNMPTLNNLFISRFTMRMMVEMLKNMKIVVMVTSMTLPVLVVAIWWQSELQLWFYVFLSSLTKTMKTVTKTMSTDHDNGNDVMLRLEIHVQISALAAPAEAHLTIATKKQTNKQTNKQYKQTNNPCSDLGTCSPSWSPPTNCYSANRGEFSPKSYTRLFCILYTSVLLVFHSCVSNSIIVFWSNFFAIFQSWGDVHYYLSLCISYRWLQVRPYLIPDSNDLIRQVGKWLCFWVEEKLSPQRQRQELNESRPHACSCPR